MNNLGSIEVFYGENGAGKSNILSAIELFYRLALSPLLWQQRKPTNRVTQLEPFVRSTDFWRGDKTRLIRFRGHLQGASGDAEVDLRIKWSEAYNCPLFEITGASENGAAIDKNKRDDFSKRLRTAASFYACPAIRSLAAAAPTGDTAARPGQLAVRGYVKEALAKAKLSTSRSDSDAVETLSRMLTGPPLHRPPFRPVFDPDRGYDLVEQRGPVEESIDLAGLGIEQIYAILAGILMSNSRTVSVEEPEAHLHAPSTGRHLRTLLLRLVEDGHVDQLFIATHSNLFDLDPDGYWDVRLSESRETRLSRRALHELYGEHLYEPGPALAVMRYLLRTKSAEEVVFRRTSDGVAISAGEMLQMLDNDSQEALDYLQQVYRAATRVARLDAIDEP